ncbi:MAG: PQQ-dependent dehydrogenase, methanol/ethanol family, partial [Neptuniibacter sp.]
MKKFALSALVAAMTVAGTAQAGVTDKDIVNDQMTTGDVVSNGMGLRGQRYSPMDKINTSTVKD